MARPRSFDETEVLDRALDIFWEKGYHATSYEILVARMGINRASIYNTYGDKHQLYIKALQRYRQKSWNRFQVLFDSGKPMKEIIRLMLEEAVQESVGDPLRRGCMVVNTAIELGNCDPEIGGIIVQNQQQLEAIFASMIAQAQQHGELSGEQRPEALARFIFNTYSGLRVLAKSNPDPASLDDVVKVALAVLT